MSSLAHARGQHVARCLSNIENYAALNAWTSLAVLRGDTSSPIAPEARPSNQGSLNGKLIGVKDNICTKDLPTTAGSALLKPFTSSYDATVVEKLREHGAILAGKTNLDEFGMGSHSLYSCFGSVKNPQDEDVSAGGSSGGSAVTVATDQCWAAIGTDTGGSVRLPAAYTGVVGFKPSYGLISRWGVIAYANSLDTVGILAKRVSTIQDIFRAVSVYDPKDPTSLTPKTRKRFAEVASKGETTLRIGVPLEYNISELSPTVHQAWYITLLSLQRMGHTIHPVSLPTTTSALSAYYVLAPAEASSNLAKYDGVRYGRRAEGSDGDSNSVLFAKTRGEGFGDEVKRRIVLGAYTLSAKAIGNYFIQAQRVRRKVQEDFDGVFRALNHLRVHDFEDQREEGQGKVDLLVCPTAPTLPPSLESLRSQSPVDAYTNDVFTVPASLAGLPAVSVPVHVGNGDGLKGSETSQTGMQVIGQLGDDELVLQLARQMEEEGRNNT
ncbi:MAG: Glu-AdT subunit A [Bogoriella megaspora]|nr:MAG: Glu-AdT subunit A [Bogoriella megaspora]